MDKRNLYVVISTNICIYVYPFHVPYLYIVFVFNFLLFYVCISMYVSTGDVMFIFVYNECDLTI